MTISLYDASVLSYLQTLEAVGGFLDKTLAHCKANDIDPETIVETRIFPNMRPFRYQIQAAAHHSGDAIEAVKNGTFRPPAQRSALDYAGLQALIADTHKALQNVTPDEVNSRAGAEVVLQAGQSPRLFTAEGFLLSFSLPNFHFHSATAYNILRGIGVPVGKRDFMGALRLKG